MSPIVNGSPFYCICTESNTMLCDIVEINFPTANNTNKYIYFVNTKTEHFIENTTSIFGPKYEVEISISISQV